MKCRRCGARAVAHLRHHNLALCEECYSPWLQRRVRETIKRFHLFDRKAKILVAVSGGKDSLALWMILTKLGYEADGLYIDLGIDTEKYSQRSLQYSRAMAERLERTLHVITLQETIGKTIPELPAARGTCSVCGLVKRHYMNTWAIEHGYDVTVTGHNLDDEAATLLSNVLNWQLGYLERQAPCLDEREGFIRKAKPLVLCTEKEMLIYCMLNNIEYIQDECPYSVNATSIFYKEILNRIEHEIPGAKLRFYSEFIKVKHGIFKGFRKERLTPCKICKTPTTGEICAFCKICIAPPKPQHSIRETSRASSGPVRAKIEKSGRNSISSKNMEIKTGSKKEV